MKTKHGSATKKIKPKMGILSSLFGSGQSSATKYGPSQPVTGKPGYLEVDQSSVELSIFTADVDVKLSPKVSAEIHRSTKKNPPRVLKYELIYVCLPLHRLPGILIYAFFRQGKTSTMRASKKMTLR